MDMYEVANVLEMRNRIYEYFEMAKHKQIANARFLNMLVNGPIPMINTLA